MKHQLPKLNAAETALGIVFLFAQLLLIPIAIGVILVIFRIAVSEAELNALCFGANFACAAVIFHRYWLQSIKELSEKWSAVISSAVKYFIFYYAATIVVNLLIFQLDPTFSNANDESIAAMSADAKLLISICVVLLVPPVEEILYRGIVFGKLHAISPILAYAISMVLFAAIHVLGYIGTVSPMRLLLCFLQYLPAGYCLARAYAVSGNLFASILIHSTINLIASLLM